MNKQNFLDNWKSSLLSGSLSGAIGGVISGGMKGYNLAKAKGANPWTGYLVVNELEYTTTPKIDVPLQVREDAGCYALSLEYADSGRGNKKAAFFSEVAGGAPGADPTSVANSLEIPTRDIINPGGYRAVGKSLIKGQEVIGLISIGESHHTVNLISLKIGDKLNLFGGGYKVKILSSAYWDPLRGYVQNGNKYFSKFVVLLD